MFKNNAFVDHRLGENDPTLTAEEKAMQRLIAERTVRLSFRSIKCSKDSIFFRKFI